MSTGNTIWEKSVGIDYEVAGVGIDEQAGIEIIQKGSALYLEVEVAGQGRKTEIVSAGGTVQSDKVRLDLEVASRIEVEAGIKNIDYSSNHLEAEILLEVCIDPPFFPQRCREILSEKVDVSI